MVLWILLFLQLLGIIDPLVVNGEELRSIPHLLRPYFERGSDQPVTKNGLFPGSLEEMAGGVGGETGRKGEQHTAIV